MKEYKDLKIMEVLSGYFIFKELLDNNLITKQDSGYTINVNEANVYLENQLLEMQQENQQLKQENDQLKEQLPDYKSAWEELKNKNLLLKTPNMKLLKLEMQELEQKYNLGGE